MLRGCPSAAARLPINCCVAAGIVHRDLKLENMLMVDSTEHPQIKIADFGLSKCFAPNDPLATMCGSPQVSVTPKTQALRCIQLFVSCAHVCLQCT